MTTLEERELERFPRPGQPEAEPGELTVYTRYGAAPQPVHPVHEPRFVHTMLVAAWLGRLIDPLPHQGGRLAHEAHEGLGEKRERDDTKRRTARR